MCFYLDSPGPLRGSWIQQVPAKRITHLIHMSGKVFQFKENLSIFKRRKGLSIGAQVAIRSPRADTG
jgi:hypothetical protein